MAEAEKIEKQTEALAQSSMKIGEVIYKAEQEKAAASGGSESSSGGDDGKVVDATYEEVDKDKKAS